MIKNYIKNNAPAITFPQLQRSGSKLKSRTSQGLNNSLNTTKLSEQALSSKRQFINDILFGEYLIDFGIVVAGQSTSKTFPITNISNFPVNISF